MLVAAELAATRGALAELDKTALADLIAGLGPLPPIADISAAQMLEASVDDLDFGGGAFSVKGSPDQRVTITANALGQSSADTLMHIRAGETLTVEELLDGMLLASGDDAASAIAVDTVGMSRFVAAMNAQVAALGLGHSHFTATAGLDDPGLYSSASDLAVIAAYTYERFPLFDQIVGSRTINLPASIDHPAFHLHNLNALLQAYPASVGIKPGWTGDAGACLIGMAVRNGHHLLAVLLSANSPARIAGRLFDWGFQLDGLTPLLPPTLAPKAARA